MDLKSAKTYVIDLAERAGWTFVQGAGSAVTAAWAASGLDQATSVDRWSALEKIGVAAVVGGGAAVLSLAKGLVAGLKTGTASTSAIVAATAVPQAPVS